MPLTNNSALMKNLQDRMMKEIHSREKTIEDIVEVLKRIPIHPQVAPAIKAAHALGYINRPSKFFLLLQFFFWVMKNSKFIMAILIYLF